MEIVQRKQETDAIYYGTDKIGVVEYGSHHHLTKRWLLFLVSHPVILLTNPSPLQCWGRWRWLDATNPFALQTECLLRIVPSKLLKARAVVDAVSPIGGEEGSNCGVLRSI